MREMNAGTRTYSIRDLENFCGIKAHTIRMWEKRYGILTPERSDSNIRYYTEDELKKLLTVSLLNRNGMKISRIARLSDSELLHEVLKTGNYDANGNGNIDPGELIMSAMRFSEVEFRDKLSHFVREKGLIGAYLHVLYPLMQKARALWLTDCISRPHEQFIRHVISTILISEEMSLDNSLNGDSAVIINLDETGSEPNLLFLKYLLHKKGYDVVYTEDTLSVDDIRSIHSIRSFNLLVINLSLSEHDNEVREFSSKIADELKLKKVLVVSKNFRNGSWISKKTEAVGTPHEMVKWTDSF
jgi:DNA-binding transcriptional MerR regulator